MENEKEFNRNDNIRRISLFFSGMLVFQLVAILLTLIGFQTLIINLFGKSQIEPILMFSSYLIGVAVSLAIFGKDNIIDVLKNFKVSKKVRDGISLAIIMVCCTLVYNLIISKLHPMTDNENEAAVENMIINNPYLSFFTVVIFAPILEEITYRFALFGVSKKLNRIAAYIITMLVFAFLHFDFSATGEKMVIELLNLPAYIIAAGFLTFAYDYGGLATSISAHAFNNLLSLVLTLVNKYLL